MLKSRTIVLCFLTAVPISVGFARPAERNDTPNLPERSAKGRISSREFFKRFPDHALQLISSCQVAEDDFGTYRPGERLQTSFMVMAAGTNVGLNHKTAPAPVYAMRCELPAAKRGTASSAGVKPTNATSFINIVPDRGFT